MYPVSYGIAFGEISNLELLAHKLEGRPARGGTTDQSKSRAPVEIDETTDMSDPHINVTLRRNLFGILFIITETVQVTDARYEEVAM
jgi:hypothetical protein